MFLFIFGGTLFLQHVIWLIVYSHLYYTIRFLIHFFSLTNHFISFLLVFFVVVALFIFSLLDKTNFLSKPQNASSWDIPNFKRVIVVIHLRLIATFSPLMSLSLRTHILLHLWVSSCFWSLTSSHYLPTWCSAFSPTSGLSSPSLCRYSSFGRGTCWLTSYPFSFSCPGSASFCWLTHCSSER